MEHNLGSEVNYTFSYIEKPEDVILKADSLMKHNIKNSNNEDITSFDSKEMSCLFSYCVEVIE